MEAVVVESVIAKLVTDTARAREPAWAQEVLRRTCRRYVGGRSVRGG